MNPDIEAKIDRLTLDTTSRALRARNVAKQYDVGQASKIDILILEDNIFRLELVSLLSSIDVILELNRPLLIETSNGKYTALRLNADEIHISKMT